MFPRRFLKAFGLYYMYIISRNFIKYTEEGNLWYDVEHLVVTWKETLTGSWSQISGLPSNLSPL